MENPYKSSSNRYIEAIEEWLGHEPSIFLAGGITGTFNWQPHISGRILKETNLTVINPRRSEWPGNETDAAKIQIDWGARYLAKAHAVLFWFPKETVCPIALFELGLTMEREQDIFVGHHPEYEKAFDLQEQMRIYRNNVDIVTDLDDLAQQVVDHEKDIIGISG